MTKAAVAKAWTLTEWQDGSFHSARNFFDDFPGSAIDTSKWTVYDRDGDDVNGDVNVVRPANATLSGGNLNILAEYIAGGVTGSDTTSGDATRYYATAQLATKKSWRYGRFEARVKTAGGAGIGPLFWMLGDGWKASQPFTANTPEHNWPANTGGWWEIDIMEFGGGSRTVATCAAHVNTSNVLGCALPFDANTRYMVYRMDWQPTYLRWYVDAEDGNGFVLLREITDTSNIPTNPGYLICHCEMGGYYGTPTSGDYPLTTMFDYVRVTQ